MAFQGKHSRRFTAVPNLIPGEFAVGLADAVLWLRGMGDKVGLDILGVQVRAPRSWRKSTGAPAIIDGTGALTISNDLAPSSTVDGKVVTDAPPVAAWGVPGVYGAEAGAPTLLMSSNDIAVERLAVANDSISISAFLFKTSNAPLGPLRIGVLKPDGTVLLDGYVSPRFGTNIYTPPTPLVLPRGDYIVLLWASVSAHVEGITALLPEQGWDYASGAPVFVNMEHANTDMSGGVFLPTITPGVTSINGGVQRRVLMQWS